MVITIVIDRWILAFVIVDLQREMDEFVNHWNSHITRPSNHAESPGGIPNYLYEMPSCLGIPDLIMPVDPILCDAGEFYLHSMILFPCVRECCSEDDIKEAWGLQKKQKNNTY